MSTYIPSLAASTGTRNDSASKHNMPCKVDTKLITSWMTPGGDLERRLHTERLRFAVQKDELVMNVSYRMFETSSYNAYPAITSTLSEMSKDVQKVVWGLYAQSDPTNFKQYSQVMKGLTHGGDDHIQRIINEFLTPLNITIKSDSDLRQNAKKFGHMPFFRAQGYALGTGYASSLSGDTVCTVMVGGMHSCMNGAFTFHAGDLVQWYFTGEEDLFQQGHNKDREDGERLTGPLIQAHSRKRNRDYHDRYAFGSEPIKDNHKSHAVFRIKPYRMFKDTDNMYKDHYGDKIRVFAKCIGGARPYEMMDIMLMTQSL